MLAAAVAVEAGYVAAGGRGWPAAALWWTALATGLGNAVNDCYDLEVDRLNKPRRPLPSGALSLRTAQWLYRLGLPLAGIAAFPMLPTPERWLGWTWLVLVWLYAARLKRTLLVGNLLVAAVASSAFLMGSLLADNPRGGLFPALFAALFVFGREALKGAEDLEGDRRFGVRTLAVVWGVERALGVSAFFLALCALIAPLPSLLGRYGPLYLLSMELLVVPGLLVVLRGLAESPSPQRLGRLSWILKGEMFLGALAMAAAHVNWPAG
jgi:geranylgeranylglycerol-phosphate geranylgeranyltransferase